MIPQTFLFVDLFMYSLSGFGFENGIIACHNQNAAKYFLNRFQIDDAKSMIWGLDQFQIWHQTVDIGIR